MENAVLTDKQIAALLSESKVLRSKAIQKLKGADDVVNQSRRATVRSADKRFSIMAVKQRRDKKFSVHVRYHPTGKRKHITLLRCNGFHGPHLNKIERTRIPANRFHIHLLTERYQRNSPPEKTLMYAEETNKYHCFKSAVEHVCYSYGFHLENDQYAEQYPLFEKEES